MSGIGSMMVGTYKVPVAVAGGGASAFYPASTTYSTLSIDPPNSSNIAGGSGSFTYEGWFYPTEQNNTRPLIDTRRVSGSGTGLMVRQANDKGQGQNGFTVVRGGGTDVITGQAYTLNTWYHIALSRDGSNLRLFLNGTQIGSTVTDSTNYTDNFLRIGGFTDDLGTSSVFKGYVDEVRMSNIARYTTTFTPSTTPFNDDANTLFLFHADGTNNSTTFTDSSSYASTITRGGYVNFPGYHSAGPGTGSVVISTDQFKF